MSTIPTCLRRAGTRALPAKNRCDPITYQQAFYLCGTGILAGANVGIRNVAA
jgi:hypothetical protein